jgi:hypothetical protein
LHVISPSPRLLFARLFRYLDEQAFRFNNRVDMNDADRFDLAIRQIVGKRLTYAELIGSGGESRTN